jgi:hypothetical protein
MGRGGDICTLVVNELDPFQLLETLTVLMVLLKR